MKVQLKNDFITNIETGESKYVVTETNKPVDMKNLIIGGASIIFGVYCMIKSAYKNGCKDYNNAEFKTLDALGLTKKLDDGSREIG